MNSIGYKITVFVVLTSVVAIVLGVILDSEALRMCSFLVFISASLYINKYIKDR